MLTREIMGALALAILWVNTLLIAAVALKQAREKLQLHGALRPLAPGAEGRGLVVGRVAEGMGEGGALASTEVEQIARAGAQEGDRRTIHFGDRAFRCAVAGGAVIAGDERVRVAAGEGDVWPARADVLAAAASPSPALFDAVFQEAKKARGHVRTVRVELLAGSPVWIGGDLHRGDDGLELRAAEGIGRLVSAIDPRAWLRRAAALAIVFAIAEIVAAAGVTALVLVPPIFDGWPSKIGGVLGLGFFLAVQPLGTAVRDALRAPSVAFVRGRWIEDHSAGRSEQQRVPVE